MKLFCKSFCLQGNGRLKFIQVVGLCCCIATITCCGVSGRSGVKPLQAKGATSQIAFNRNAWLSDPLRVGELGARAHMWESCEKLWPRGTSKKLIIANLGAPYITSLRCDVPKRRVIDWDSDIAYKYAFDVIVLADNGPWHLVLWAAFDKKDRLIAWEPQLS
jgi:hypothetical protein